MFMSVSGKRIHYILQSKGAPLVFVHGWGGTTKSLYPLASMFKKNLTLTVDLPGFGESETPQPEWGVAEYADVILKLCKKLRIEKFDYFGHSFGGSLGIFIASHHPEYLNKLVLCGTSYKREVKVSRAAKILKVIAKHSPLPSVFGLYLKQVLYRIFFRRSDLYRFPHLEPNFRKIILQDLSTYLDRIKTPTLILWGKEDGVTPVAMAQELKEKIYDSKLVVFPEIKHNLPLKYPELVYRKMIDFL